MNSTNLKITTELSNCRVYRVGGCPYFDFYNNDCLELMKTFPDNHFDLAVVDVPYGIMNIGMKITKPTRQNSYKSKPKHEDKQWDTRPNIEYWNELFRVSKNQVVWGGNYLTDYLPVNGCWLFWDKINGDGSHFADGEFAWTSFKTSSKRLVCSVFHGLNGGKDRIHPTEKPIRVYDWVLGLFSQPNFKILDTHLGSASIAIAVHRANVLDKMNLHLTGIEIDADYFQAAMNRIKKHVSQGTLPF